MYYEIFQAALLGLPINKTLNISTEIIQLSLEG
jgi:hypothetical protein